MDSTNVSEAVTYFEKQSDVGGFAVTPQAALEQIREVQAVFKEVMIKDEHYGVIPGSKKPTLYKAGAELLANMYQYAADDVTILEKSEQWDTPVGQQTFPLFRYLIQTTLRDRRGRTVSVGLGECNSYEAKYRWRQSERLCPVCEKPTIIKGRAEYGGGWICFAKKGGCGAKFKDKDPQIEDQTVGRSPNDAIYDIVNTILKMAKKRSFIDAVLSATRTSGIFTQDIEDFATLAMVSDATAVDVSTGEIKSRETPSAAIVPFGLYKGRDVTTLTFDQLAALVAAMKGDGSVNKYPDFYQIAAARYALQQKERTTDGDPFDGAFDRGDPVKQESLPLAAEVPQVAPEDAEAEKEKRMQLLVEVRELMEQIIPKFNEPKPKLTAAEKKLAAKLCKDAFGAETWTDVTNCPSVVLTEGMPKLTKLVEAEYLKQQKGK